MKDTDLYAYLCVFWSIVGIILLILNAVRWMLI